RPPSAPAPAHGKRNAPAPQRHQARGCLNRSDARVRARTPLSWTGMASAAGAGGQGAAPRPLHQPPRRSSTPRLPAPRRRPALPIGRLLFSAAMQRALATASIAMLAVPAHADYLAERARPIVEASHAEIRAIHLGRSMARARFEEILDETLYA